MAERGYERPTPRVEHRSKFLGTNIVLMAPKAKKAAKKATKAKAVKKTAAKKTTKKKAAKKASPKK